MSGINHKNRMVWACLSDSKPFPRPEWSPSSCQHLPVGPWMGHLAIKDPNILISKMEGEVLGVLRGNLL